MRKKEIIELYLADLSNLVPDSDAKRSRIIDLEDELQSLNQHEKSERIELLKSFVEYAKNRSISEINIDDDTITYFLEDFDSQ